MSYKKIRNASTVRYTSGGATGAIVTTVEDQLVRTLYVRDFGALGDGVTNDTVAIQNALDALVSGDILEFGSGRYVVEATLTLAVSGVMLRGGNATQFVTNQGPTAHIILTNNGTTAFELSTYQGTSTYITPAAGTSTTFTSANINPTEIIFDGLAIHNRTGSTPSTLIGIDGTGMSDSSVTVINCHFGFLGTGILAATAGQKLVVKDNYFLACQNISISVAGENTLISNNEFGGSAAIVTPTGVSTQRLTIVDNFWNGGPPTDFIFDSSAGATLEGLIFSNNNIFVGAADPVLDLTATDQFVISGNVASVSGSISFIVNSASNSGTITGNNILSGSSTVPIFSIDGDNVLISGNTLSTADGDPIIDILSGASNTRVLGNSFLTNAGSSVEASTAVTDAGTDSIIGTVGPTGETGVTGATEGGTGMTGLTGLTGETGETGLTGSIPDEQIDIYLLTPDDRKYTISLSAKFPTTVVNMTHRLDAGTIEASLEIDGVSVGGLDDLAVTTTPATPGATGANEIAVGQELVLSLTGDSGALGFAASIQTERA